MVPSAFVALASLPLTANGKLDHAALPAAEPTAETAYQPPRTPEEALLCELVGDLLGMARVGAGDNFFHLGGDSISSIQLVGRARARGLVLSPRDIFASPTMRELAAAARAEPVAVAVEAAALPVRLCSLDQAAIAALTARYGDVEDILPLTPLQEGLLFHATLEAGAAAAEGYEDPYTVQLSLDLSGPLDGARLAAAARALLRRQSALRACFVTPDGSGPVQVILRDPALPWREEDLSGLDAAACEARLEALAQAERAVRFDPSSAPLLRFVLVRLDVQRHRLLMTNHHLLLDGWSMPLLLAELLTLYRLGDGGASLGRPAAFASHLRWLAGRDQEAARAAWGAHLAGLSGATLLAPSHSVARRTLVGQRVVRTLDASLSAALGEMARGAGLTLATLLQGAWAILLGRLTGRDDVVFGVTVSGRTGEVADDDRIIGLLINTVPVRVRLAASQPVRALLSGLQAEQAGLLAHQHVGLAELQRMAGVGVLFDTAMVVENYPLDAASLADAAGEVRLAGASVHDASHYPLSLVAVPGERLELILRHHPDLIGDAEAAAIADRLVRVLAAMVATPELPVSRLDVLPALEREAVLVGFNTATAAPPGLTDASLVSLFAAQVARAPWAVALIHGEAELSYAALEVGANRLAHHLRGLGVGPEQVVGICLDRSFGLVEAMLAVLKAGGAYLPLDPAYPPERLAMMLADAAPVAVLTTSALAGLLPADAPCVALDQLDLERCPQRRPWLSFIRTAPPMSSTPPAARDGRRAWWCRGTIVAGYLACVADLGVPIDAGDMPLFTAPTFDLTVTSLFLPLSRGGAITIADGETAEARLRGSCCAIAGWMRSI